MNTENIKKLILKVISNMGIYINDTDNDIDLTEYISSSLEFITMFIDLEDALSVELPDYLLMTENIKSINGLAYKISIFLRDNNSNMII